MIFQKKKQMNLFELSRVSKNAQECYNWNISTSKKGICLQYWHIYPEHEGQVRSFSSANHRYFYKTEVIVNKWFDYTTDILLIGDQVGQFFRCCISNKYRPKSPNYHAQTKEDILSILKTIPPIAKIR